MLKGLKKGNENDLPSVKIKRDGIWAEKIGVLKKQNGKGVKVNSS